MPRTTLLGFVVVTLSLGYINDCVLLAKRDNGLASLMDSVSFCDVAVL